MHGQCTSMVTMRAFIVLLLTCSIGCANSLVQVPDREWKTVPQAERAQIDHDHSVQVEKVKADRDAARLALRTVLVAKAPTALAADSGDASATALPDDAQSRYNVLAEVRAATLAWQRARIAYFERRIDAADAHLAVLGCAREVARAKAVDRHRLGFDTYDSAEYRGQLAQTQERWYAAMMRAATAREALVNATLKLAAAKEAYATLVRVGAVASSPEPRSTQVAGWKDPQPREPAAPANAR